MLKVCELKNLWERIRKHVTKCQNVKMSSRLEVTRSTESKVKHEIVMWTDKHTVTVKNIYKYKNGFPFEKNITKISY